MPRGNVRMFSKMHLALLALGVLIMFVVQANASILSVTQFVGPNTAASRLDGLKIVALPHSHDHSGLPCHNHDGKDSSPCCCADGCSILAGWLPVVAPALPRSLPADSIYWASSTPRPEDLGRAPTLKPPRSIV